MVVKIVSAEVEKKFDPISIRITFDTQESMDKMLAICNHQTIVDFYPEISELRKVLIEEGADCFVQLPNLLTSGAKLYSHNDQ